MKKLLLPLIALFCCSVLPAVEVPKGWTDNIQSALARAKKENKNVLILFTGSDWCGWCKRLKKDVLERNKFQSEAKNNFVLVYFDFPSRNRPSAEQMKIQGSWQRKFGVRGYPTTVIVDSNGKKLGVISGYRAEKAYLDELEKYSK